MLTCSAKYDAQVPVQVPENNTIIENTSSTYKCSKCYKIFTRKDSLVDHFEICRGIQNPYECSFCHHVCANRSSLCRHTKLCIQKTQKEIESLPLKDTESSTTNAPIIIHIHNHTTYHNTNTTNHQTNTIHNNTQINNFGEESKHIDPMFIEKCLRSVLSDGVPNMVQHIHCNPDEPINQNVRIYSKKQNLMKIRENNQWNIKDKDDVLDKVIQNAVKVLTKHYNDHNDPVHYTDTISNTLTNFLIKLPQIHKPAKKKVYAIFLTFCEQIHAIQSELM